MSINMEQKQLGLKAFATIRAIKTPARHSSTLWGEKFHFRANLGMVCFS